MSMQQDSPHMKSATAESISLVQVIKFLPLFLKFSLPQNQIV